MAKTYADIQKQIDVLTREAERLKQEEIAGVIDRIKEAIKSYGLTASDLGLTGRDNGAGRRKPGRKVGAKKAPTVNAKYRDEAGNTWGGRGPRPQWLRDALSSGKTLKDFAV